MKTALIQLAILIFIFTSIFSQNRNSKQVNEEKGLDREKKSIENPVIGDPVGKTQLNEKKNDVLDADRSTDHHRDQQRKPDIIQTPENVSRIPENTPSGYTPSNDSNDRILIDGSVTINEKIRYIYTSEKERGKEMLRLPDYGGAMNMFLASLDKNPRDLELYYLLAVTEFSLKNYEDALKDINYYLSFFNDDGDAYYQRGMINLFLGNRKEAQADFVSADQLGNDKAYSMLKKYF